MSFVGFQMWEPYREHLIAQHCFYFEQARKRLLSQFDNMDNEAHRAADEYLEEMSKHFNRDVHDSSSFYDSATERGIEFYQLLSDMQENIRLSVVAGMFHQWDKILREWIIKEMRHWHYGQHTIETIWKVSFSEVVEFLVAMGFDVKGLSCYERLNAMRLVVNVFKHGNGASLKELKASYPEFIDYPLDGHAIHRLQSRYLDHTYLKVSDEHLDQFSEAILDFWRAVPSEIYLGETMDVPKWFENAYLKDVQKGEENK